jgi:hypothetical protein
MIECVDTVLKTLERPLSTQSGVQGLQDAQGIALNARCGARRFVSVFPLCSFT